MAPPPDHQKNLELFKVFWKQLHLIGSTMGSPADFFGNARICQ